MPQHPASHAHSEDHSAHLNPWLLGGVGAVGGITLAPYALPLLGIGNPASAQNIMHFVGGHAAADGLGNGLAAGAQGILASIPFVGGALTSTTLVTIPVLGVAIASGALLTIGLTAVIGVGGMLLANWMQQHEDPHAAVKWSKVVRVAALSTSALIALPGILGGLSVGITFLASLLPGMAGSSTAMAMKETLGATSMEMGGAASGIAALLPHLFTCGAAFIPLALAFFMGKKPGIAPKEARMELVSTAPTAKGQATELAFRLVDAQGTPLRDSALATTFTEKLHTMVVDTSLRDYHHLHPRYDVASGLFRCQFTPGLQGSYMAWHDFTLNGANAPTHQRIDLPGTGGYDIPPRIQSTSHTHADGLNIAIDCTPPLKAGNDSTLRLRVTDDTGRPVEALEPIMGAYGHLAGFSADGRHFIHSHPLTPLTQPLVNGQLEFHLAPEHAGMTQFFLQLRHQGREVTLPFGQAVQEASRFASRIESARQKPQHQHMAA